MCSTFEGGVNFVSSMEKMKSINELRTCVRDTEEL